MEKIYLVQKRLFFIYKHHINKVFFKKINVIQDNLTISYYCLFKILYYITNLIFIFIIIGNPLFF